MARPRFDIKGWTNRTAYLAQAQEAKAEVRYQDSDLIIVRAPCTLHYPETWSLLERVPGCVTDDWWLAVARTKLILRSLLVERYGSDSAPVAALNS